MRSGSCLPSPRRGLREGRAVPQLQSRTETFGGRLGSTLMFSAFIFTQDLCLQMACWKVHVRLTYSVPIVSLVSPTPEQYDPLQKPSHMAQRIFPHSEPLGRRRDSACPQIPRLWSLNVSF